MVDILSTAKKINSIKAVDAIDGLKSIIIHNLYERKDNDEGMTRKELCGDFSDADIISSAIWELKKSEYIIPGQMRNTVEATGQPCLLNTYRINLEKITEIEAEFDIE